MANLFGLRRLLITVTLMAMLTAAPGCSNSTPKNATPAPIPSPVTDNNDRPSSGLPGRPAPKILPGQTPDVLRLSGPEPITLEPAVAQDVGSWIYLLQIFSGLVSLDDALQVVPDMAEWRVDGSGRIYTFTIRKDARFHNGRAITAADFKYSLERASSPSLRSASADIYLGDIVGVKDKLAGRAPDISGVKVRGDYVLEIAIDAPKPYFLAKLTYPTAFVVDRETVERNESWWERPNGSGPFKLKLWDKEAGEIVLEANENYYGVKPRLREASFFFAGGSSVAMYERDLLDVAAVGPADIDRVTDPRSPLSKELAVTPQLSLWYLGFNTRAKPFDDLKVRQAFNLATDRQRIVEVLLRGMRVKANGILPPGIPGFDQSFAGPAFDPVRAKELLAQSSYGSADRLPPITLTMGEGAASLGQRFADMYLQNLGVQIDVEQADRGFYDDLNAMKYQMFYLGWIADYPDPQDFLDILFHADSLGNHTGYSNRLVDSALEMARVERDERRRWQLYRDAERRIVDDSPVLPLFHDVDYVLVKPEVKGLTWTPMGLLSLKNVVIQPRPRPGVI